LSIFKYHIQGDILVQKISLIVEFLYITLQMYAEKSICSGKLEAYKAVNYFIEKRKSDSK